MIHTMAHSGGADPMDFIRDIGADISDPSRWPSLSEDRLCHVIGHAILLYAHCTAEELVPYVIRMYPYLVERVPPERRYILLHNITSRFSTEDVVPDDTNRHCVDALLPFIVHDPDPRIVYTATLDFAILRASTTAPWLGVNQAFSMFEDGKVANRPAILRGLIVLGDRRLSPRILSLLTTTDVDVVQEISKFRTQWVFAATVELCCDWLAAVGSGLRDRDPGGSVYGHVAAALYRLGTRAGETGVSDVSRVFPPPAPHEAALSHEQWTQAEYAEVIGPRMQQLARDETAPRIMPSVLAEWGNTLDGLTSEWPCRTEKLI